MRDSAHVADGVVAGLDTTPEPPASLARKALLHYQAVSRAVELGGAAHVSALWLRDQLLRALEALERAERR